MAAIMEMDLTEFILRLVIGGAVVSFFSVVGEIVRPKSFAGLFGAAPSIALATLGMTISERGTAYAATEARSMILGALAFFCYAIVVSWVLLRLKPRVLVAAVGAMPVWFLVSFVLWLLVSKLGAQ